MPDIFKISSDVATPLALAGLFAAVLFFTFRQLLSAKWFPKLATDAAGEIIKRIVNYLFVLSLVAMVLGFAGFLAQIQPKYRPTNDTNKPPVVIPESNLPQNNRTQGSIKVLIEPAEAIEQGAQ